MGNYICTFKPSKPTTAKFVDIQGNLRRIDVPITAAELMLESPNHVISSLDDLCKTRRIPAMRADEELQAGKAYLVFPEDTVYCKVSELEMALIVASCRQKGLKCRTKVFPVVTGSEGKEGEGAVARLLGESSIGCSGHRTENGRQWMPVLEPIYE